MIKPIIIENNFNNNKKNNDTSKSIKEILKDSPFKTNNIQFNNANGSQSSTTPKQHDIITDASHHMTTYIDPNKNQSINQ